MIAFANDFASRGHRVDLVLVRAEGPFLRLIGSTVKLVDLAAGRLRRALPALSSYVRYSRPELLVSALAGTDTLALIGRRWLGWKTRVHLSVQNSPLAGQVGAIDWFERRWPMLIRRLYRHADSISAISAGVAAELEALLGREAGSVPVFHNPLDLAAIEAAAAEPSGIDWLEDGEGPVLLAVGRLVPQKDYPTLLRAFAKLRETRDVRLIVLGEGQELDAIEGEIARLRLADHVRLAGFSSNPFAAMAKADVFVLSSRWEGFANVVAEALACGTKVVSTDCPSGPAEILHGGAYGWLAPVGDADALAAAVATALDAPADRDRLRARARDFAVADIAARYEALFRTTEQGARA